MAACMLLNACATGAPHPASADGADQALANRIYTALNADPWYFYRHVDVRVDDGVADLSGYVWSADAVYQARRIAAATPGVRRVVTSRLELERNGLDNSAVAR
ncbi:MAG: BON domain-containing protein [Gammaproteobacteria bacterium]|nr:BON domain-containing protein [Gammaproteobacteria bacterium]